MFLLGQTGRGEDPSIAAQVFLVWVIIGYVMPFFGLELLDMARDVAAFNLPARAGQLYGVNLSLASASEFDAVKGRWIASRISGSLLYDRFQFTCDCSIP